MTSPKWVIDTPSTSTANQDPSEQKFSTIPLNDNGLEMVPIEMATIANETFSSAENVPPAPFLRGSSQQQNEDSIRFPHLPAFGYLLLKQNKYTFELLNCAAGVQQLFKENALQCAASAASPRNTSCALAH
ncbi:hypothetical protein TYRP_014247 [Tyrophagus putrescentiae]|nr:hypothetical protein TYRP_014247 [Tyrophagus putrescentiae]